MLGHNDDRRIRQLIETAAQASASGRVQEADRLVRQAEAEAAKVIEEARAEARVDLEAVRAGIEKSIESAQTELQQMAQTLAVELTQRVLGRPVNAGSSLNN